MTKKQQKLQELEEKARESGKPKDLFLLGCHLYYDMNDPYRAAKVFSQAARIKPNNYRIRAFLGMSLVRIGAFDFAKKEFEVSLKNGGDNVIYVLCMAANAYTYCGEERKARKLLKKALSIEPDYEEAYLLLSETTNSKRETIRLLRKAISFDPNYSHAYCLLGLNSARMGKFDRAEKEFREAIRLDKRHGTAYLYLGRILFGKRKYEEALCEYRKAVRHSPGDPEPRYRIAQWFEEVKKDYKTAERYYRKAIVVYGEDPDAFSRYGKFLLHRERLTKARKYVEWALMIEEDNAIALDVMESMANVVILADRRSEP